MRKPRHWGMIIVLAMITGCAAAPDRSGTAASPASEVGARLTQQLKVALEAGDADGVARIFTVDGVAMPAEYVDLEGREAIRNFYRELLSAYAMQVDPVAVETWLQGDHGYTRGTYRVKMTPKDGSAVITGEGRYLTVLRRQPDGTWLASREMTNSSRAP